MTRALEAARDAPTDAELEPVARALVMLHTPEYADDVLWAEHWALFLHGMNGSPDLWRGSYQGVALSQARAAVEAWQAARVVAARAGEGGMSEPNNSVPYFDPMIWGMMERVIMCEMGWPLPGEAMSPYGSGFDGFDRQLNRPAYAFDDEDGHFDDWSDWVGLLTAFARGKR